MELALVRGLVLGFLGGIPVGPVNAAVIDTGLRKCFLRAFAVGVGGAFVDFLYSQLALSGVSTVMASHRSLAELMLFLGGVSLIVFGVFTVRRAAVGPVPVGPRPVLARALAAAFLTGMVITLANPAALVTWVLLAGTVLSDLSRWEGLFAGIGIFAGTALWFLLVSWLATKGRVRIGHRSVWITRVVGVLLVGYGVFLVGKASVVVWAAVGR